MKRLAALVLALICLTASCAFAAQDYTVAEKLLKQLWAGSGFTGTLEVSFETPSLSTQKPIVIDADYIYVRPTEEDTAQHRLDLNVMDGENAVSAAYAQLKDGALAFQADVISPDWYVFDPSGLTKEPSAAQQMMEENAGAVYEKTGMPTIASVAVPIAVSLLGADGLDEAVEPYKTRLDVWLEAYRQDAVLDKLEDGTTTMSVSYDVAPAAIKAQLKQMVLDFLADDALIAILEDALDEDAARLLLDPELRTWHFRVIDDLPLHDDLTISRTVSLKGDTLNLHLKLPMYDPAAGPVTLEYDRTKGAGDLPEDHTIRMETQDTVLQLLYQQYSSMTGVEVTQGRLEALNDEGKPVQAVLFTLRQQESRTVDADTREVYGYDLSLTLRPDEEAPETPAFSETEITLASRFMSRETKSAPTEADITLTLADETGNIRLHFNGTSRKMWQPEELPDERVDVNSLTQADIAAILPGAALRVMALFAGTLSGTN